LAEVVGFTVFLGIPYLAAAFDNNPEVVAIATKQAHVESLFYCLLAFSHCIAGIMRGAGKSTVPMFTMLASWCLIRITYISVTVHFIPKIQVIFWAYPLTWSISSVIFLIYFLKADWIHAFEK
ncbi:MAG: MATE family efflux transporter, partial [Lachnospiraceae bacterium]|nr:MATE family efflux transporter [Lachnospiraceae bacterium]